MRPEECNQSAHVERLMKISACLMRSPDFRKQVIVSSNENDRWRDALGRQAILQLETAQTTEMNVEDDALGLAGHVPCEKLLCGTEGLDANAVQAKGKRKGGAKRGIIVDDADPRLLFVCTA